MGVLPFLKEGKERHPRVEGWGTPKAMVAENDHSTRKTHDLGREGTSRTEKKWPHTLAISISVLEPTEKSKRAARLNLETTQGRPKLMFLIQVGCIANV